MASITSNLPGDINQAKRSSNPTSPAGIQQLTRQAIQPQPATISIAQRDSSRPSPMLPGDPARAARMQAQMSQPVTKVDQGSGIAGSLTQGIKDAYRVTKPLLNPAGAAAGILAAPVVDAGRNALIRAAGGDPNTSEGGATKYQDRAFGDIQPAINAAQATGHMVRSGASSAVLSLTGAQPAAQPRTQGLASNSLAQLSAPVTPKPAIPNSAEVTAPPVGGYVHSSVGGIARRGNEFANDPAAVSGAGGQPAKPGAVKSGWDSRLELDRNERANIERQRMVDISRQGGIGEGGGRLSIVGGVDAMDLAGQRRELSIASGSRNLSQSTLQSMAGQGAIAKLRDTQGEARSPAGDPAQVAAQRSKALIEQQLAEQGLRDRQVQARAAGRLAVLQEVMADLNAPREQREAAAATYTSLTTPAKDRYVMQDTVIASDPINGPKYGKQAIDVITGQPVSGVQAQVPGTPQPGYRKDGYVFQGGDPSDQRNWRKG